MRNAIVYSGIAVFVLFYVLIQFKPPEASTPSTATGSVSAWESTAPKLQLNQWTWEKARGNYVQVRGEVQNVSGEKLEYVKAVVSFYDADGTFISSERGYMDFKTLMPGQVTPFEFPADYNPAMSTATIQFAAGVGGGKLIGYTD